MERGSTEYVEEYSNYYQIDDLDNFEEITFDEDTMWSNLWRYLESKTQPKTPTMETNDDHLRLSSWSRKVI